MPASISSVGFIQARKRAEAYSLRYTAVKNPIGAATSMAMTLMTSVAVSSGQMPNSPNCGCHTARVRKSTRETSGAAKKSSASRTRT